MASTGFPPTPTLFSPNNESLIVESASDIGESPFVIQNSDGTVIFDVGRGGLKGDGNLRQVQVVGGWFFATRETILQ